VPTSTTIQVRLPDDILIKIDRVAQEMTEHRGGEPVNRSEVVRVLLRRALAAENSGESSHDPITERIAEQLARDAIKKPRRR